MLPTLLEWVSASVVVVELALPEFVVVDVLKLPDEVCELPLPVVLLAPEAVELSVVALFVVEVFVAESFPVELSVVELLVVELSSDAFGSYRSVFPPNCHARCIKPFAMFFISSCCACGFWTC